MASCRMGVDRHDVKVLSDFRAKGGARVEVILSGTQVAKLAAQGVKLEAKRVGGMTATQRADKQAAEGYEVYPVADAVGGISKVSHERAFDRMLAAGARPITAISFGSELMRNWARPDADNLRQVMRWYFPERQRLGLD